jgi:iron-sulfur cluster insertion protein
MQSKRQLPIIEVKMLTLTADASEKIKDLIAEEGNPNLKVRLFIEGGGCSGFNYGFTFDEIQNDDDWEVEGLLVDAMSMQYLEGSTINWKKEVMGSSFVIDNPNAVRTCGCGSSFSI